MCIGFYKVVRPDHHSLPEKWCLHLRDIWLEQVTRNQTSKLCREKQKARENAWDVKRAAEEMDSQTKM